MLHVSFLINSDRLTKPQYHPELSWYSFPLNVWFVFFFSIRWRASDPVSHSGICILKCLNHLQFIENDNPLGCNNLWKQCCSGRHNLIYANEIVRYWSHLCIPHCRWEISCPFISDTRGIEDKENATIISGFDLCWLHQTSIDSPDKCVGKIRGSLFWNAYGKFTPFTF